MADLAQFETFGALPAAFPLATATPSLVVPKGDTEQRVVLYTPDGGGWRVGSSGGKVIGATAYNLTGTFESVMLAPGQELYAMPTATQRRLCVFIAPREDDYFESGGLLCHDVNDPMGG